MKRQREDTLTGVSNNGMGAIIPRKSPCSPAYPAVVHHGTIDREMPISVQYDPQNNTERGLQWLRWW